jgi:hypothetical protein
MNVVQVAGQKKYDARENKRRLAPDSAQQELQDENIRR